LPSGALSGRRRNRAGSGIFLRTIRAVRILARDGRIPRPLRGAAAFGLLPLPGPLDEAVLLLVGLVLSLFYRERLSEAWRAADPK
jgi:hypothetical protein